MSCSSSSSPVSTPVTQRSRITLANSSDVRNDSLDAFSQLVHDALHLEFALSSPSLTRSHRHPSYTSTASASLSSSSLNLPASPSPLVTRSCYFSSRFSMANIVNNTPSVAQTSTPSFQILHKLRKLASRPSKSKLLQIGNNKTQLSDANPRERSSEESKQPAQSVSEELKRVSQLSEESDHELTFVNPDSSAYPLSWYPTDSGEERINTDSSLSPSSSSSSSSSLPLSSSTKDSSTVPTVWVPSLGTQSTPSLLPSLPIPLPTSIPSTPIHQRQSAFGISSSPTTSLRRTSNRVKQDHPPYIGDTFAPCLDAYAEHVPEFLLDVFAKGAVKIVGKSGSSPSASSMESYWTAPELTLSSSPSPSLPSYSSLGFEERMKSCKSVATDGANLEGRRPNAVSGREACQINDQFGSSGVTDYQSGELPCVRDHIKDHVDNREVESASRHSPSTLPLADRKCDPFLGSNAALRSNGHDSTKSPFPSPLSIRLVSPDKDTPARILKEATGVRTSVRSGPAKPPPERPLPGLPPEAITSTRVEHSLTTEEVKKKKITRRKTLSKDLDYSRNSVSGGDVPNKWLRCSLLEGNIGGCADRAVNHRVREMKMDARTDGGGRKQTRPSSPFPLLGVGSPCPSKKTNVLSTKGGRGISFGQSSLEGEKWAREQDEHAADSSWVELELSSDEEENTMASWMSQRSF